MKTYEEWRHVFKLDPAETLSDDALEQLCESGTDAVIVGGTDNVTEEDTLDLLMRIRRYSTACALEVSDVDAVVPGFDYYLVPSVLNSRDREWVIGRHHQAMLEFGPFTSAEELIGEGYCILNPEAKAAVLTNADTSLDTESIEAYARTAEQLFRLPVFYLEYSGTYGDPSVVKAADEVLEQARLFYGGGITTTAQAAEMAAHADTIVVGNIIYEDLKAALKTVEAVQSAARCTK
ncbi:heptaprenylglyceryl phosphate synthase [Alkalicoccus chagannorensis]|uniref:heptaprenylglyceryl phosphate synthase n=1 Tax=Alkalicoccus chagannorensis TaxID=427072 RepID=UPI0003F7683E|nr:heptaprenylglyceryl phosphate synthase [Alkalicoccus chagannorensis]